MFDRSRFIFLNFFIAVSILHANLLAQTSRRVPLETIHIDVNEGTNLSFDVSPDGRTVVFDLLGQIWIFPTNGGKARAVTDAVKDVAEDNDPSFSPDGRQVVFQGERNGRTGLWILNLPTGRVKQITQLPEPEAFDGNAAWSPDGRSIAFVRATRDYVNRRIRSDLFLFDVATATTRQLAIDGVANLVVRDPVWIDGGRRIAFVASSSTSKQGGRVWAVPAGGGKAVPIVDETKVALAPDFSADGQRMAFFASDPSGKMQLWVMDVSGQPGSNSKAVQVTNQVDVTPTRIRWIKGSNAFLYSANGRLWKATEDASKPVEIPFSVSLSISRPRNHQQPARFPEPGQRTSARGFMGLAISPDGQQIGALALGKLWVIPVGGIPRAVADVPFEAAGFAWSPDEKEVAWSAGAPDKEDIFVTQLATGVTRQITALPGREADPAYSPDGRYLAFTYIKDDDGKLLVVDSHAANATELAQTKDLGSIGTNWTCTPQWSPESDGLLVCGGTGPEQLGHATFVPLSGKRKEIKRFSNAPIFLQWTAKNRITFVRHDRLWSAAFNSEGLVDESKPIGNDAALYLSSSRDGSLLYVSEKGLRLRRPGGQIQDIGWPLSYTGEVADATLIRNVRIIDGTGRPMTGPRDIFIEKGRIARIGPTGSLLAGNAHVIDGGGRVVIPGLMDLHAHTYRPDLLPGFLYFGVTTVRDQGSSMAPLVSYADNIAAGLLPGPRVSYGGFQFYSDWAFDEEQGRGIEPEADPDHIRRSVALLAAFGAQHIKTRTFRRWDINARMISEAHKLGLRATGHCSHLLPLIAAGMNAKEHIGVCETRGNEHMYDDMIQLFRAAGVGVVPTISYWDFAVTLNEKPTLLDGDTELAPFMPTKEQFGWMLNMQAPMRHLWTAELQNVREGTAKLWKAGVTIGTGTDIWQIPIGVHMELEELVRSGLTPLQAIQAATYNSAHILGADKQFGSIETGKWADLVILDADPLKDIRNTRRIWQVYRAGKLVDRPAILKVMKPQ